MNSEAVEGLLLASLWDMAYNANRNTSFSPDKRATYTITVYSEELAEDLAALGEHQGNYKEKYTSYFSDWLRSKGNTISSMITGPANFPVRRAEKANRAEQNKYEAFRNWREKYFRAVNREPRKSPEEELILAEVRLEDLTNHQLMMKEINALLRKMSFKDLSKDEIDQKVTHKLNEDEYPEKMISEIIWNGNNGYGYSFPSFTLTNNNAKIKSTKDKVIIMLNRIERKKTWEDILFDGGRVTLEDDRIKVIHDSKPERTVIDELKKNGFRWSPHWSAWVRQHTGNAVYAAKSLSFVKATINA